LNIGTVVVFVVVTPLWVTTWVTAVCVQSLPTSVTVNWNAVVVSDTLASTVVTSGTKPDGGAMLVETSQSPSATRTNGYCSWSSVQSNVSGWMMSRYVPKSSVCVAGTIFQLKVARNARGTFLVVFAGANRTG
jgi:hypothetical protein